MLCDCFLWDCLPLHRQFDWPALSVIKDEVSTTYAWLY